MGAQVLNVLQCQTPEEQRGSNFNVNSMSRNPDLNVCAVCQEYYEDSFEIFVGDFSLYCVSCLGLHCWRCNVRQGMYFLNLLRSQFL